MEKIQGKGVSGGMVMGRIHLVPKKNTAVSHASAHTDPENEKRRFRDGCRMLQTELEGLYRKTKDTIGEAEAEIFTIHQMMLEADEYTDLAEEKMDAGMNASQAAITAGEELAAIFSAMDDPYMQAREADIRSIAERLAAILQGEERETITLKEPVILAMTDLSPAQTMELDLTNVLGFITEQGTANSHTAILARTLGIPAVAAAGTLPPQIHGKEGILDGRNGILYVTPDETIRRQYEQAKNDESIAKAKWESMRGKRCSTSDGKHIRICANAGNIDDVQTAVDHDAEGIGLFRSEFLFMQYDRCPTEEEQYAVYRKIAERMPDEEVVIRTLDAGADKKIPWLPAVPKEENPALGFRAVRICLRYPELLTTQLRALYRASVCGKICAMIPMITIPSELESVQKIAAGVRTDLQKEGIPYNPAMPIGIMIETPSAALYAETLAESASFFSIGTNDLTQYTMAADRENGSVAYLTETVPESVKALIRMSVQAAKKAGIPAGVCGEMAGNASMIPFFLEEGITKLSVSPGQILRVRMEVQQVLQEKAESGEKQKG